MEVILTYVIPFLIVLGILVFVHELGHYVVARFVGVRVDAFSIGFGPELFGWTDRNKTRWKVSLVPLGGYVKMAGDASAASNPDPKKIAKMDKEELSHTLHGKTPWQRMAVSAAGPFANYLLAFVIFLGLFSTVGQRYVPAQITSFSENSVGQAGGLLMGDRIIAIEGTPIQTCEEMRLFIAENPGVSLEFLIMRGEDEVSLFLTPASVRESEGKYEVGKLGVGCGGTDYIKRSVGEAAYYSASELVSMTGQSLSSIWQMITGQRSAKELGGPLRIAQLSGEFMKEGVGTLLWFMGFLSIGLGFLNLLPIPVLDGGHIFIYLLEGIRGKAIDEKVQERIFLVGFFLIGSLMIFSFWNDLCHLSVIENVLRMIGCA